MVLMIGRATATIPVKRREYKAAWTIDESA